MTKVIEIGFIGLGVMGEPICRNLAIKSNLRIRALDQATEAQQRLSPLGVESVADASSLVLCSDVIFLCLPSGEIVADLTHQPGGLLESASSGQVFVDLGTTPVDITRDLAGAFGSKGARFVDAPVARSRLAASAGTLSCMVGADAETFERMLPLLRTFATDVSLCGPVGCGQVVKILNNYLLYQTGAAIAEVGAIGQRAGIEPSLLFEVLAKGSADSFALRHHAAKAMALGDFPKRSFSVESARKDLRYAIAMAKKFGIEAEWGHDVDRLFVRAIEAGYGDDYWPVISRLFEEGDVPLRTSLPPRT